MDGLIPQSKQTLKEALALSTEILQNIEKSELSLTDIALKTSRLARLLNDFNYEETMRFEASGYPVAADGLMTTEHWKLATTANRLFDEIDHKTNKPVQHAYIESISQFETIINRSNIDLQSARDPDISISSANPYQIISAPMNNAFERAGIRNRLDIAVKRLASRRSFIHNYVLKRHYEIKYSGIAEDIFSRTRNRVDTAIGNAIPKSIEKFTSVYNNLLSENPEDWSNAVHSCRRILQDLADAIYPAREDKIIDENGKKKPIKLGPDSYINRLICFVEEHSISDKFKSIVGSHLSYMGDRLDSVFESAQKGSHSTITTKEEADRYVVYTYLIVGDILSLL